MDFLKKFVLWGIVIIIGTILTIILSDNREIKEVSVPELHGKIAIYFKGDMEMKLEKEYRNVSMDRIRTDVAKTIVEEVLKGPNTESLKTTIPKGTKLNSVITNGKTVTVDLSKEFEENQNLSEADSLLAIYSIVNSLTEITEIEEVKFLIDGKQREKYKEQFDFDKPFYRGI